MEQIKEQQLEQLLWAIKESAWKVYANAFWQPGVPTLVESVTSQVNTLLRDLGYDPTSIVRNYHLRENVLE